MKDLEYYEKKYPIEEWRKDENKEYLYTKKWNEFVNEYTNDYTNDLLKQWLDSFVPNLIIKERGK